MVCIRNFERLFLLGLLCAIFWPTIAHGQSSVSATAKVSHGIGIDPTSELKYGVDFTHFDYVEPQAPKGGSVTLASVGKLSSPYPLDHGGNLVFETLLAKPKDENSAAYGLIAASIEVSEDHSWVAYNLRADARWHDGTSITAEDVIFSFNTAKEYGGPFYSAYYADVISVEKIDPLKVKFEFSSAKNLELPLILGEFPIIPKQFYQRHQFDEANPETFMGSGPYRIMGIVPEHSITYERVKDYWGENLPVRKGQYNFNVVQINYYRDHEEALTAFKARDHDIRFENSSKFWATGYNFPARKEELVVLESIPHQRPTGMSAFIFNTRKERFKDRRVRKAISLAFDFEWANQNLFSGQYTRMRSYFSNSELASRGLPSAREVELLERFRDQLPEEVFGKEYNPPVNDGTGAIDEHLKMARELLLEAGWIGNDQKLVNIGTGEPMEFEFLLKTPGNEKYVKPFIQNLSKLGINAQTRVVDSTSYWNRVNVFDFDVIVGGWPQSNSPGNELRYFWGSDAAETPKSRNRAGIRDSVIDDLIEITISAPDRKSLVVACRALDRVLLWGHYVIPTWHLQSDRVAYWNRFGRPATTPTRGVNIYTWWIDPQKDSALATK